jgi:RimJ/RimL family protein N-acetyltransferase
VEQLVFDQSKIIANKNSDRVVEFNFRLNQKRVAWAKLEFFNDSEIPFYYLISLYTEEKMRNKGLATDLLKATNDFLEKEKSLGLLVNTIPKREDNKGVHQIYTKNGWREVGLQTGGNIYMFQPETVDDNQAVKLENYLKEMEEEQLNESLQMIQPRL